MVSRVIRVQVFDLVVFGATGDLACRKIFPALYNRFLAGQMPNKANIIGAARKKLTDENFRLIVSESLKSSVKTHTGTKHQLEQFLGCFQYVVLDVESNSGWNLIRNMLRDTAIRAFYLSVAPKLFNKIASKISEMGLFTRNSRIVIEKPLGVNERSAKVLKKIFW